MRELHELSQPELEQMYEKKVQEALKAGKEWAEAKAEFEACEEKRKAVLSTIMGTTEGSQAAKEQFAYSNPRYEEYLSELSRTRADFLHAQVDWELSKIKIECIRSIMSNRREETKAFK